MAEEPGRPGRLAVIGAGTMGRGIAHAAAVAGLATTVQDVAPAALQRARRAIEEIVAKGVELGKLEAEERDAALARIAFVEDLAAAVQDADLVIEAVPERMAIKLELFAALDRVAPPDAILATNTSSLSVTEMAAATNRAGRCIGLHFFNPVQKMKLLEIVRGLETEPATVAAAVATARRLNKEPVVIRESPGFITSRMNALIGNEAFALLAEGVASAADIDKAMKLGLNHPMGPFELVDLVGLDTRLHILEYLYRTLGEKYRPHPLLVQYVRAGRLGRKSGRGVYEYPQQAAATL
ncbi:MAG: 3-hydroxyacyl-CoA dehydrogenase family protein [Terriglobales bacterium]